MLPEWLIIGLVLNGIWLVLVVSVLEWMKHGPDSDEAQIGLAVISITFLGLLLVLTQILWAILCGQWLLAGAILVTFIVLSGLWWLHG